MRKFKFQDCFVYNLMRVGNLVSAQQYQRTIKNKIVNKICDNFDPRKFDPVKVAIRNGKYYLFDGQHRATAVMKMFGDDALIPCLIFKDITYEVEAELFAEQDQTRNTLKFNEVLNALYQSGRQDVVQFCNICAGFGFDVNFKVKGEHCITSYSYLFKKIYEKDGSDMLRDVLTITTKAYGASPIATDSFLLQGVRRFIEVYGDVYKKDKLIQALKNIDNPRVIRDKGRTDQNRVGEDKYCATLLSSYNAICRGNNKLPMRI